jgi:hypothetical protein
MTEFNTGDVIIWHVFNEFYVVKVLIRRVNERVWLVDDAMDYLDGQERNSNVCTWDEDFLRSIIEDIDEEYVAIHLKTNCNEE